MNCECCAECDPVGNLVFRHEMRQIQTHQSVLEISRNAVVRRSSIGRIIHDLFRATHPEENNVIIELLMYSIGL